MLSKEPEKNYIKLVVIKKVTNMKNLWPRIKRLRKQVKRKTWGGDEEGC